MGLSGIHGSWANTSQDVNLLRYRFKVIWIYAAPDAALVIKNETCRDRAVNMFI